MTNQNQPINLLCLASYFKGVDFMKAAKELGCNIFLVTSKKLESKPWPREVLEDIFYMNQQEDGSWNLEDLKTGLAYLMRSKSITRIIALDDFDVEKGAFLREHFRIPGMGQTTARHFRDKLAMRMCADEAGILVPPFSPLFTDAQIHEYTQQIAPPWVVKPRSEASSAGITKINNTEELWALLNHKIGEDRHNFLIEQFTPGNVYHVDSLIVDGKVVFAHASQYLNTPFEVAHSGGIFRSCTVAYESEEEKELLRLNEQVLQAFGMRFSASHTEIIRSSQNGQLYFLETSSRVGGAHIAEEVAFATGVNLWAEWAKIEVNMARQLPYTPMQTHKDYAGIIISLTRQEKPDDSAFNDPEICWRMKDYDYHIGFIMKSQSRARILYLLDNYAQRIYDKYHASAPAPDKPAH